MMAIPQRDPDTPPPTPRPTPAHIPHIHAVPPRPRLHAATSTTTTSFALPPPTYSSLAELSLAASILLPRSLPPSVTVPVLPPALRRLSRRPSARLVWAALFADGPARAAARLVLAILTNHVRRMLAPSLGAWVCATPLAALKLAVGSPHLFLDAQLVLASAPAAWGAVAQKGAVDVLGGAAARMMVEADAKSASGTAREVAVVGVLVWALAAAEYVQARTCHAVAVVLAVGKLVGGPAGVHRAVLGEVVARRWVGVPLCVWWVVYYLGFAVGPMVWGACASAARGRPGMLGLVGATAYVTYVVTRWSNKYYIVLELWGFVLVVGWVVIALLILAGRAASDILDRLHNDKGQTVSPETSQVADQTRTAARITQRAKSTRTHS